MKQKIKDSRRLQNRRAGLPRTLPAACCCVRAQAPIQHHTDGTPANVYFFECLICGTPVISGLNAEKKILIGQSKEKIRLPHSSPQVIDSTTIIWMKLPSNICVLTGSDSTCSALERRLTSCGRRCESVILSLLLLPTSFTCRPLKKENIKS